MESTRKKALEKGDIRYFTGKPCKKGHLSPKYTKSSTCIECVRKATKVWREKHGDGFKKKEIERVRKYINRDPKMCWARNSFRMAKKRAKSKGVPFELSSWKDLYNITVSTCPALGLKLSYGAGTGYTESSPTIDRTIPALGYVKDNVNVISKKANQIKSNATIEEVKAVLLWMIESQKGKDIDKEKRT